MKRFLLLILFASVIRLLVFPYTSITNEGDSVSRILISWDWLENPTFITHGGWGPLHFYLIAGALWLWFDPVHSPALLHIFISIITAIPLWAFVRREWGETAALFVSAAYLFYPLSFRLGFLPTSEIPVLFFVASAMYFLSVARAEEKSSHAILAGLSMTFAASLRIEPWTLIPLFAILLWGKWKLLGLYLISAAVFPIFWMIGNLQHGLDPIAHLTIVRDWQLKVEGINEGLNAQEVVRRLIYFPATIFFGLTPPLAVFCFTGMFWAWKDKTKRAWSIPFLVLLPVFMVRTAQGLGTTQARFSLLLGLLLLPFSAVAINRIKEKQWAPMIAVFTILAMIPLSYSRVVLYRLAGPLFPNPFPADLEAIPKIDRQTKELARLVQVNSKRNNGGLLIDFFGKGFYPWKDTNYVALMSHVHPSRLFFMPGGRHQKLDRKSLSKFLWKHPTGTLLRSDESRHIRLVELSNGSLVRIDGFEKPLLLRRIASVKTMTLYDYRVSN
ncbi:glycosyltransferase family 39 protein [bacterium]|nr:glycosyltransferase family 39 protein [bacterium]